ncbi:MAG: 4'-phosphopantetheinyl transferase superfamily protein [Clostridia bacterium]|nr:4'-phosphopantetheinyl transferase superfamily protein [Clostridia bacterium]
MHSTEHTDRLIERSLSAYGVKEPVCVLRTKKGKPYVSAEGLFVGVSHTATLVLVAVAPHDFGMDVERRDRRLQHLGKLMETCCTPEEKEQLLQMNIAERTEGFLTLWTRKEALLKQRGAGLCDLKWAQTNEAEGHFHTFYRGSYIITVYAEDKVQEIKEKNMDGVCFE